MVPSLGTLFDFWFTDVVYFDKQMGAAHAFAGWNHLLGILTSHPYILQIKKKGVIILKIVPFRVLFSNHACFLYFPHSCVFLVLSTCFYIAIKSLLLLQSLFIASHRRVCIPIFRSLYYVDLGQGISTSLNQHCLK